MSIDFTRHSALVLGAGGPMAKAVVDRLSRQGASVVLASAAAIVERARAGEGADILVTVLEGPSSATLAELGDEDLSTMLEQELAGTVRSVRAILPLMRAQDLGRIVCCVPSAGAFGAHRGVAQSIVAAGITALARSIAIGNLDCDIRTNIISYIAETPATETLFEDHPVLDKTVFAIDSVLPAITYLASEACALNGETISAGAGRFARLFTSITLGGFDPAITDDRFDELMSKVMDIRSTISPRTVVDELITVAV